MRLKCSFSVCTNEELMAERGRAQALDTILALRLFPALPSPSYPWLLLSHFFFLPDLTSIFSLSPFLSFFYPSFLTVPPVPPCRTARRPTSNHPQIRRGPFPQLLLSYARGFSEDALKIAVV